MEVFTVTNISKNGSDSALCSSVTVKHTCTDIGIQRASDLQYNVQGQKEEFNSPIVDYLIVAARPDFDSMGCYAARSRQRVYPVFLSEEQRKRKSQQEVQPVN